jgi:alpha-galactosidase
LDPGSAITTDWACIQIFSQDDPDPFGPYFRAVAREHGLPEEARTAAPTGWCSWYQFYRQVSADGIRRALHTLQAQRNELPVQIVQIDDGYQTFVGDWSTFTPGFAAGIAPLAAEIRAAGYKPGLWMAPFLVDPRARLAKDHPEWLLHGFLNRPVNAGYGFWGTFTTALDLSHPQALNHIQALVDQAIRTWGIEYLKLDFLHAGALPGRHFDPTRTRAQLLRLGLQAIRQAAGAETFLLGCGCPLGPAIGLIDSMRVGPDVDVRWEPAVFGISTFFRKEPDLPSIRNANRNPLVRAPLHRRLWINDPDCLLLSPKPPLTFTEIQGRATLIAMTGGALFFSDDLQQLPADCLRLAQFILSPIGKRPRLLDWTRPEMPSLLRLDLEGPIGVWYLLAFFNWQDKPADINFSLQDFILPADQAFLFREIWGGECGLITNGFFKLHPVPAHGAILLALRPHQPDSPTFVGSELHISQGLEVADWQPNAAGLTALIQRSGKSSGYVYLYLPQPPILASLNNNPLTWQTYKAAEQIYAFPLSFDKNALLQIQF